MTVKNSYHGNVFIAALIFVALALSAAGGLYLWQTQPSQQPVAPITASPTPPATDAAANWKTYTNNEISFKYPASWEVLTEVPQELRYQFNDAFDMSNDPKKLETYLGGKMFADKCRGPILRNTKIPTTVIAVDVPPKEATDGMWCFSAGYFGESVKRPISTLKNSEFVDVSKWKVADKYLWPVTKDNSGTSYTPPWKGDWAETYFLKVNQRPAAVVLFYQDNTDKTAEPVFDQILATFRFN